LQLNAGVEAVEKAVFERALWSCGHLCASCGVMFCAMALMPPNFPATVESITDRERGFAWPM